jgi:DNA-binding NtrC family response regulator
VNEAELPGHVTGDPVPPGAGGQPEAGGPEAGGPGEGAQTGRRDARILILEDEEWDAELAQRLLTTAGMRFSATVVDTRAAFVERLETFRPDVILSDFALPGFSGEEALAIAQQACPQTPFIIWSGVLGDEVAVGLIKMGATDYILKDRPARLPSAIQRALQLASQRAYLSQLEDQLAGAQRLASTGQLTAAQHAVAVIREMLADARHRAVQDPSA